MAEFDVADPLARGVPSAAPAGYHLLGAPVGDIPFSRDVVEERILKISEIFDRLPAIDDAQTEFALLRSCFSPQTYLLFTNLRSLSSPPLVQTFRFPPIFYLLPTLRSPSRRRCQNPIFPPG